jgi:hypothetical protein
MRSRTQQVSAPPAMRAQAFQPPGILSFQTGMAGDQFLFAFPGGTPFRPLARALTQGCLQRRRAIMLPQQVRKGLF